MSTNSPIKLYWSGGRTGVINYGDLISRDLVARLTDRPVVYASPSTADLCAAGSILERAIKHAWKRPFKARLSRLVVWGTGTMQGRTLGSSPWLDIRAVRGPLTRQLAGCKDDMKLGDPGLLADLLLDGRRPAPAHAIGLIPHVCDFSDPQIAALADRIPGSIVVDLASPDTVTTTRLIASCEAVLSSSLHGLIVADALGIPRARMIVSDRLEGGDHKFRDHDQAVDFPKKDWRAVAQIDAAAIDDLLGVAPEAIIARRKADLTQAFAAIGL